MPSGVKPPAADAGASTKVTILSTESIATPSQRQTGSGESCTACGAPLAADQRYCLQCGERRMPVSGFLQAGPPMGASAAPSAQPVPPVPPAAAGPAQRGEWWQRNNTLSVIAGVGVLLLAMGVGILIGRSSSSPRAARPEVVTIGSLPTSGVAGGGTAAEATFKSDWPAGKSAYTVQLQTLPEAGTTVSQVEQAKSSAGAKGATAVGALKSEEFASLTAGSYIVYSGQYKKQAEAHKALAALKKEFPSAKVIHVANGSGSSSGGKAAAKGSGSDLNHPAPASVLEGVSKARGKSYEEKSKNLPNVVETG